MVRKVAPGSAVDDRERHGEEVAVKVGGTPSKNEGAFGGRVQDGGYGCVREGMDVAGKVGGGGESEGLDGSGEGHVGWL